MSAEKPRDPEQRDFATAPAAAKQEENGCSEVVISKLRINTPQDSPPVATESAPAKAGDDTQRAEPASVRQLELERFDSARDSERCFDNLVDGALGEAMDSAVKRHEDSPQ